MTQDEVEKRVEKILFLKRRQWVIDHTFKVFYKYGNTYITCNVYDDESVSTSSKIKTLLELMGIDFWIDGALFFPSNTPFSLAFHGENHAIGDFIQKFINNGYLIVVD